MTIFQGLMKYDDWATDLKKYKQQQKLLQTKIDLETRELDLREKTLEFNTNKQNDDIVIDILKVLNKSGSGGLGKTLLGSTGPSSSSKKFTSNKDAIPKLKSTWGITNETLFKLLGNTNLEEGVGNEILLELNRAKDTYEEAGYLNIPNEEIGMLLNQVVSSATQSKPYEGLLSRVDKLAPDGISATMKDILEGFESYVEMGVNVGGIPAPDKRNPYENPSIISTIDSGTDTRLAQRLKDEEARLLRTLEYLTNAGLGDPINKEAYAWTNQRLAQVKQEIDLNSAGRLRSFYGTGDARAIAASTDYKEYAFDEDFFSGPNVIPTKFATIPSKVPDGFTSGTAEYQKAMVEKLKAAGYLDPYDENNRFNWFSKVNFQGFPEAVKVE